MFSWTLSAPVPTWRLDGALQGANRFRHLEPLVASLFGLQREQVRALLDRLDRPCGWLCSGEGVEELAVEPGPGCLAERCRVVRIEPGARFVMPRARGLEFVAVLEGGYRDEHGVEVWRGEVDVLDARATRTLLSFPHVPCLYASLVARSEPLQAQA